MEHDPFHPNVFHQPSYNLQMYEEFILTTSVFPLVYLNDLYCDYFLFHTPGKQDHLTVNIHFNLIISMEYTLKKFTYSNSRETMTFHLGKLFSRYHIGLDTILD